MCITVGYDGTTPSSEAVLWAADEASSCGADLRIITCYEILAADAVYATLPAQSYSTLLDDAEVQVGAIADIVRVSHPGIEVSTLASPGPASSVLVADARADDLVVIGASSHHRAAAFWLGSTPRAVVRHAPCPVVVVRGPASRGRPDRVVVGVDGSPAADRALRWAGDEADRHGVPLLVVHGWQYPYLVAGTPSAQARDLTEVDAACVLDRAVEIARERCGVDVTGALVDAGPAVAVLESARDGDLLVVGSSGKGAISARVFGSTVNSVLEHAAVPVVVVRRAADES